MSFPASSRPRFRRELDGDPTTWNRMMYGLKLIADCAGQRGAGMLVAVVQQQVSRAREDGG